MPKKDKRGRMGQIKKLFRWEPGRERVAVLQNCRRCVFQFESDFLKNAHFRMMRNKVSLDQEYRFKLLKGL